MVLFEESITVAIVPVKWIIGKDKKICYWPAPKIPASKISKLIQNLEDRSDTWEIYDIRILGKAGELTTYILQLIVVFHGAGGSVAQLV